MGKTRLAHRLRDIAQKETPFEYAKFVTIRVSRL
jgi:hypothetical protein